MSSDSINRTSIEAILDDETDVRWGENALTHASHSTRTVAEIVASTMGPYGRDKLIVNNGGNVHVTNDAVTILRNLHLTDPVGRVVRDLANSQIFNAGDGTTTSLVLAGELLDRALELYDGGFHPTVIADGYQWAADQAKTHLSDIATVYDITDRDVSRDVAQTTLAGSNTTNERAHLSELSVDAVKHVTDGYDVNLNAIKIRTASGHDMSDSRLVPGAIIEAIPQDDTASRVTDRVEILPVDGSITRPESELVEGICSGDGDFSKFHESEQEWREETVNRILGTNARVILCSGDIDQTIRKQLSRRDRTCVSNVSGPDFKFLRYVFDSTVPTSIGRANASDTITGSVSFDWQRNRTTVTTPTSGAVTIQLYGQTDAFLDELDNTISDALEVVAQVAYDGRVLPGGGAPEMEMAGHIRTTATKRGDKTQIAALAFADALETIPRTLAKNAGLNPIDCLHSLRSAHATEQVNAGLDLDDGDVIDMTTRGVRDSFIVKRHAITNSVGTVNMLLRIDGILQKKQL